MVQPTCSRAPGGLVSTQRPSQRSFSKSYEDLSARACQAFRNHVGLGDPFNEKKFSKKQLTDYTNFLSSMSLYSDLFHDLINVIDKERINIAICGVVDIDGQGDLWNMGQMQKGLEESFKQAKVIRCIDNLGNAKIPPSSLEAEFYHWPACYRFDEHNVAITEVDSRKSREADLEVRRSAEQALSTCQVIFDGAHCTFTSSLLTEDQKRRAQRVFEPGCGALSAQCLAMGLGPAQSGLLVTQPEELGGLDSLENKNLCRHLFGCEAPSKEEVTAYAERTALGVSYKGERHYIPAFCAATAADGRKTLVDIITDHRPDARDLPCLADCGINKASWTGPDGQQEILFQSPAPTQDGLEVRILGLLPVSQQDFQRLAQHASYAVGCTGDGSFVQVGHAQLPYYGIRPHKFGFYRDLIHLADQLNCSSLGSYLRQVQEIRKCHDQAAQSPLSESELIQNLGKAMADPQVHQEWTIVFQWIQQHSFVSVLRDATLRAIVHALHPEIEDRERQLLSAGASRPQFDSTMRAEIRRAFQLAPEEAEDLPQKPYKSSPCLVL